MLFRSGRQLEEYASDKMSEHSHELLRSQEREAETRREVERLRQALCQSESDARSAHSRLAAAAVAKPVGRNREMLLVSASHDESIRREVMGISQVLQDMNRRFESEFRDFRRDLRVTNERISHGGRGLDSGLRHRGSDSGPEEDLTPNNVNGQVARGKGGADSALRNRGTDSGPRAGLTVDRGVESGGNGGWGSRNERGADSALRSWGTDSGPRERPAPFFAENSVPRGVESAAPAAWSRGMDPEPREDLVFTQDPWKNERIAKGELRADEVPFRMGGWAPRGDGGTDSGPWN